METLAESTSPDSFGLEGVSDNFNQILHSFNHEAGNSLTALISTGSVLEQSPEPLGTDKLKSFGSTIVNEAWRLSRLHEFFVLTLSTREPLLSEQDISELTRKVVKRASFRRLLSGLEINLSALESELFVNTDPEQFRLMLNELMRNAYFHLCSCELERKHVELVIEQTSEGALLSVRNFTTLDASIKLPSLFQPFTKAQTASNGLGLGLTMVSAIAKRLGLKLKIKIQNDGSKNFFCCEVLFPTSGGGALKAEPANKLATVKDSYKIVIADDEPSIRSAISKIIVTAFTPDFEFIESDGGNLVQLLTGSPDLILLDINLPNRSGFDIFEHIRATYPELEDKVIFMSGSKGDSAIEDKFSYYNKRCLYKPFEAMELLDVVSSTTGAERKK